MQVNWTCNIRLLDDHKHPLPQAAGIIFKQFKKASNNSQKVKTNLQASKKHGETNEAEMHLKLENPLHRKWSFVLIVTWLPYDNSCINKSLLNILPPCSTAPVPSQQEWHRGWRLCHDRSSSKGRGGNGEEMVQPQAWAFLPSTLSTVGWAPAHRASSIGGSYGEEMLPLCYLVMMLERNTNTQPTNLFFPCTFAFPLKKK